MCYGSFLRFPFSLLKAQLKSDRRYLSSLLKFEVRLNNISYTVTRLKYNLAKDKRMFEYFYRRRQRSISNNNHSSGSLFVDENYSIFVRSILDDPSMTLPFEDRRVYFSLCGFPPSNRLFRDQSNAWTYR